MPSFSVCTEPSFDTDYLKNNFKAPPGLFLYFFQLSKTLHNTSNFPDYLFENNSVGLSLDKIWLVTAKTPNQVQIGKESLALNQINDAYKSEEVELIDVIKSSWYGSCINFVLKKPRRANEVLLVGFQYPRLKNRFLFISMFI